MSATREGGAIALAGPPRSITGVVQVELDERVIPITLKLAGGIAAVGARVRPFGHRTVEIRLRLPRETAPGRYSGEASIAGTARAVEIEVESVLQLRVQPKRSSLAVEPASSTEFGIEIANAGNVTFDIPKVDSLDLDDAEGQDRALGRALRATLAPGERRVDRFFEEIRERHGGEARVVVLAGAGPLAPAAARMLRCRLEIPDAVQVGRSYIGAWQLANAAHVFVLEVSRPALAIKGRAVE
jgi:hypothetical protein